MKSTGLQPSSGYTARMQKWLDLNLRQLRVRLAIIAGLAVLYIVTFKPLLHSVGPIWAAFVTIPVAITGWYFGINAGLAASLFGVALSALLLARFDGFDWLTWLVLGWPGNVMVVVVGYMSGRLQKGLDERARIVKELQSRERYFVLLNLTTKNILHPKNPEDAYYYLLSHLTNLFVADYAHFVRWDATQEQASLTASTIPLGQSISDIVLDASESSIITSVLQTGRALALDDLSNSYYVINPALISKFTPPALSALCIPLIARGNKLGAVLIAYSTPHDFNPIEVDYAESAGNQIALALLTVQQELKIQKRLKEANALANIERVLSETERVGIETVLQLIIDSAKELIPAAEHAVLHLLDTEQQILVPRAVAGYDHDSKTRLNMRLGEGIAGQVIATGDIIAVSDTQTDLRFFNQETPVKFRSLIAAPIQSNERRVGTISIQSGQPNAFTPDESQLLGALGTQASIAIENANLLENTQQGLKEVNALYRVSQGLVASLDPEQLMKEVVDLLQVNFNYYHVQIYVVEPQSGDLVMHWGSGEIGAKLKSRQHRLQAGESIAGHAAATGAPFVTNNVDQVIFFTRNSLLPDTQSELAVPVKVDNQVLGVLDVQQVPPGRLTQRDLQLMSAVADQLAAALQKANLYTDLQASLRQEKAMRNQLIQSERLALVGRLLASVSHELNNPLQAVQNALFLLKEEKGLSVQGRQDLEIVLSEADRMAAMVDRLRDTYRPTRKEDFEAVQVNSIVEDIQALIAAHLRHKKISLEFHPDPGLPTIAGLPGHLKQVVLNLLMNAVEAISSGGCIKVSTQRLAESGEILLSVGDDGRSIDPDILPHIFDPFVTNKDSGTGLGLTITYDIIQHHQGRIQAENNPEGGATFNVWLPMQNGE